MLLYTLYLQALQEKYMIKKGLSVNRGSCFITGDFTMATSQNSVCITQENVSYTGLISQLPYMIMMKVLNKVMFFVMFRIILLLLGSESL